MHQRQRKRDAFSHFCCRLCCPLIFLLSFHLVRLHRRRHRHQFALLHPSSSFLVRLLLHHLLHRYGPFWSACGSVLVNLWPIVVHCVSVSSLWSVVACGPAVVISHIRCRSRAELYAKQRELASVRYC